VGNPPPKICRLQCSGVAAATARQLQWRGSHQGRSRNAFCGLHYITPKRRPYTSWRRAAGPEEEITNRPSPTAPAMDRRPHPAVPALHLCPAHDAPSERPNFYPSQEQRLARLAVPRNPFPVWSHSLSLSRRRPPIPYSQSCMPLRGRHPAAPPSHNHDHLQRGSAPG
jgi:hypothetical protein